MSWKEEYKQKLVAAEEAVGVVKSGDKVFFGGGTEPRMLAKALAARKDELTGVKLNIALPTRDFGWLQPAGRVRLPCSLPCLGLYLMRQSGIKGATWRWVLSYQA